MNARGVNGRATMADVAKAAGVSVATVSRALSGSRPMSEDLRKKVLTAADDLGYRVNLVGRTLRKRRSSTVGMIVPDLDNPFFSSLAQSLSRAFSTSGIELLIVSTDGELGAERRGIQSFLDRQVDALVVVVTHERDSAHNLELVAGAVVTIELDRLAASPDTHFVGCDNSYGMQLIHDHVVADVDVDAQPVIFVGGTKESSSGRERLAGFRELFPHSLALLGSFDFKWGQQAADELLAQGISSGTVIAAADVIALGLMSRLQLAGMRVPEDFRVIGFDGVGVSDLAHPTLTTVRQPVEKMSHAIVDIVLGDPGTAYQVKLFRPNLVYGESSPARPVV